MNEAINQLTEQITRAAIAVHNGLGPGLLESANQNAPAHEFRLRGVAFEEQKLGAVSCKDRSIEGAYRLDFLAEKLVVVALKAIDELRRVHVTQVLTYLHFSAGRIGLLSNFRTTLLTKHGLNRLAL